MMYGGVASATTHYSTINSFAPATRQTHFTTLEEGETLEKKKFNSYLFLDVPFKSLSVYGESEGEDILSFIHVGLSYGLTERLEFGVRGQAIVGEYNNEDQLSMRLNSTGFINYDGFIKYNFYQGSKLQAAAKANIGNVSGSNIFFEGPGAGLNFSLDLNLSATLNKWIVATNVGYLKRTPGERDPDFAFFEPIESSILFNFGLSRNLNEKTNLRLEVINAIHDFTFDNSDRDDFSSEALISFHRKIKRISLTAGASFGLTDGISVPSYRGFLGLGYKFGFKARVKTVVEETPVEDEMVEEVVEDAAIEEPVEEFSEEPYAEEDIIEEIVEEEAVEESYVIEEEPIEELIEEPVYVESAVEEIVPAAPVEDQKFILNDIEFAFDSYELDSQSKKSLEEFYEYLQSNNYSRIEIWGHTDFVGTLEYNEYLGLSRAKAVYDYLARLGLSTNSMKYDSFGERRPVNTGLTNDFRRKNRRVEILLLK